jgi:hypothetical protein
MQTGALATDVTVLGLNLYRIKAFVSFSSELRMAPEGIGLGQH